MNDLVDTTEMYLRTIYDLEEEGVMPLRARIAERLEQSGPTVSQTVSRMERDGLLHVAGDRHLELTDKGRGAGRRRDAQAPARRTPAGRRHRAAVGGSARRGVPLGARDERGRRAPAGAGARQPDHVPVRQPDSRACPSSASAPTRAPTTCNLVRLTELPAGLARRGGGAPAHRTRPGRHRPDRAAQGRRRGAQRAGDRRDQRPRRRDDRDPRPRATSSCRTRWRTPSRSKRSDSRARRASAHPARRPNARLRR